ncbi:hypothetical protein ASF10_22895 [Flavobacterium sp. Leaf82]|uniref:PAS domain-containing protein n=1 Tax=unclassified Flavobacterium TaxID=196869 RepID=UPI0006FB489F|nr:PAS domain-containing protein [Flavobacterium sp. Leaf82]KQO28674.1 hypothetical protein ASF10_22895 [Flavobacterium sp. Leaf82]
MNSNLHFLSAGGEMGQYIRTKDWNNSPVGDPVLWPQSLRTALSIILNSRFPMFLFWGDELTCFYNDAYRPSLGNDGKHPSILGMPGEEAWPEIWEFIKPLIDNVLLKKEASWHEDQLLPIYRNGKMEDVYWTFSYSPVIDETGNPAGVFVTCSETTEKVKLLDTLSESHKQLEFAIEAAELGTYDYSPARGKFTANNRLKDWFGLPHEDELHLQNAIDAILDSDRKTVQDAIAEALRFESGGKYDLYYTIVHPVTFEKKSVHAKGKTTFDAQGIAIRLDGTLQDITRQVQDSNEKDKALKKASHNARHLNLALEAGQLGSYELDIASGTIKCSLQCKINFGRKPTDSLTYSEFLDMVLDEDRPVMRKAFYDAVASNSVYDATYRVNASDGIRWIHASAMPVVNKEGKVIGMAGVTANITEVKNSQIQITAALAQTALSREKLNIVIDASELGTWELDLKTGEIETSSRFSEIFTGTVQQDFNLSKTRQQIHPEDMEKRNLAHKEARETGKLYFIGRIIWPDDSIHWIESKGKVFYDRDGTPAHMIGTVQDITEEKQKQEILHKSEQKFRLLADSMAQHVWTSDSQGNLNYFNQSVYDYSGLTPEQILTGGWIQIVHPDDRQANVEAWTKSVKEGTDFILEHRFRNAAGEYRWQLSRAIPQRDAQGIIQMWVGTSTDIQEQRSFTDELEMRVQERTLQMQQKNVELERMNRELQTFAYISSHDLQEPLRKIQTFSDLILKGESETLSPRGLNYFERMRKSAERMQNLIDDLLAYSRTSSPEKTFENISLDALIQEVRDEIAEELLQHNAHIEIMHSANLTIIQYQFRQLLYNLISNSLKFKRAEIAPKITISASLYKGHIIGMNPQFQYHMLTFEDNGIGFDQKHAPKIFEVFQRLHTKETYEGTGIGLSIVKKIVDNHEGLINVESVPGVGTKFTIFLPLR